MTDEQLSALLRLKRYEQPAPQYFDRLLENIHRRQRSELLQRPLWKIATERLQTFFSEHSMGHLSYASALASVLVVGLAGIGIMTSGGSPERLPHARLVSDPIPPAIYAEKQLLTLQTKQGPVLESPSLPSTQPGSAYGFRQPRYIIDTRPASYEPSSAFKDL